ncbi:unnamed protein product [Caenorhabditis nigoni]
MEVKIPRSLSSCEWIYFALDLQNFKLKNYHEVSVPADLKGLSYFLDPVDNQIYINGFMENVSVHDIPVNILYVKEDNVQVFFSSQFVQLKLSQFSEKCQSKSQFEDVIKINDSSPPKKKKYRDLNSHPVPRITRDSYSDSEEIGVTTDSRSMSMLESLDESTFTAISADSCHDMFTLDEGQDCSVTLDRNHLDVNAGDSSKNTNIRSVVPTKLDRKLSRKHELSRLKKKMAGLITNKPTPKPNELLVPLHQVQLSKNIDSEDSRVKEFCTEISNNRLIGELDPIVVTEESGTYRVLSGNRRVKALQDMKIEKTKTRFIFEICIQESLVTCLLFLFDRHLNIGYEFCLNTLRKFRINPDNVLRLLRSSELQKDLQEMKREISRVAPSIGYLLRQKNIDDPAAAELEHLFSGDEIFVAFVKSTDLRSVGKKNQKESVLRKYNVYKLKSRSTEGVSCWKINVVEDPSKFDCILTSNRNFKDSVWEKKETILTCLIGVHCENSSHHTLLLPDTLGIEDDDGKLNNHVSLSLAVKYDGQECVGKNLSRFLNRVGVTNKTIFCAKDLKSLFSSRSEVFIDFSEIITAALEANPSV